MTAATSIDGSQLKQMFIAGSDWLKAHVTHVNALNVFPVPDGDTGTNMFLTLQAALKDVQPYTGSHAGNLALMASQGALMGARGNSGVILSQILDGFSEAFNGKEAFTTLEFAHALQIASNKAYNAVINPVEGTILTVIKETARIGRQTANKRGKFTEFLAEILETAQHTLRLTPEILPVLKEAGVVDAGGQGLVYFLEGMFRYVKGLPVDIGPDETPAEGPHPFLPVESQSANYGYDVQFLITGTDLDAEAIRATIAGMGDCPLVVGNAQTLKVHVHALDPGQPLSYGITQGKLLDIVVENLDEQSYQFARARAAEISTGIAVVCVAPSSDLAKVFKSLGAGITIAGGQTMNPSAQDFLQAIAQLKAEKVLLLPNNKNIILAAQQASSLAEKDVRVLPSKNVPQGISALLAFNAEADFDLNAARMLDAMGCVRTIEITRAVRNTKINGLQVKQGDVIGLLDNALIASGQDINQVGLDILAELDINDIEIISIYYGQDTPQKKAEILSERISDTYPHLDIEVIRGGQAHYQYIISLE